MARILLVEDHDQVNRLLCDVIRHAGHKANCVKTKAEALAALTASRYELVIADLRLPDGSGYEVVQAATELGAKSIIMSGHPDELQALRIKRVAHLAKPFSIDEFEKTISQHLPRSSARPS